MTVECDSIETAVFISPEHKEQRLNVLIMSRFQDRDCRIMGDAEFYIEKGQAYTEDNVLVYNIVIYGVPQCITEGQMAKFFGKFGEISELRLRNKDGGARTQRGFVNFKDAKSAVKVLEIKEHKIGAKSFWVNACNTWHQPPPLALFPPEVASPRGVYKKPKQPENVDVDPGPAIDGVKLTDLNDDCLEHILKFVGIREQLNFARVSQRFRGIVEMLFKTQHRVAKSKDKSEMTLWEVRDFLILAGPHIEALDYNWRCSARDRIVEFIIKYVRDDVKRITFQDCKMNKFLLRKIVGKFGALKELHLESCEVDDDMLAIISRLPNLETLNLADNDELFGATLKRCKNLRELNISSCGNVKPHHFAAMCAALTELRSLDISEYCQLDGRCLRQMVRHCTQLETVSMMQAYGMQMESIATLPNLKCLAANLWDGEPQDCETLCVALAEHRANELEVLKITFPTHLTKETAQAIGKLKCLRVLHLAHVHINDETIRHLVKLELLQELDLSFNYTLNDDALLQLLSSFKGMRYVNIEHCPNLSNALVKSAIEIFRDQGRQQVVRFYAFYSGLEEEDILRDEYYLASRGYIDVRFDPYFCLLQS